MFDGTPSISTNGNYKPMVTNGTNGMNKHKVVNFLLSDYSDLIPTDYKGWYAKAFYQLAPDLIMRIASEARNDGKNPKALFSYKIKKALNG